MRALEEHEEGHERNRHGGDDQGDDALRDRQRRARKAEHARSTTVLHAHPQALDEVVAVGEPPKLSPAFGDIPNVVGESANEAVGLVDERGDEQSRESDERTEGEDEGHPRRGPSPTEAVTLEPFDERVEREREEERDQKPGENLPRDPDQLEQQHDRDRERQDGKNRRGAEADNALLHWIAAFLPGRTPL